MGYPNWCAKILLSLGPNPSVGSAVRAAGAQRANGLAPGGMTAWSTGFWEDSTTGIDWEFYEKNHYPVVRSGSERLGYFLIFPTGEPRSYFEFCNHLVDQFNEYGLFPGKYSMGNELWFELCEYTLITFFYFNRSLINLHILSTVVGKWTVNRFNESYGVFCGYIIYKWKYHGDWNQPLAYDPIPRSY